MWYNRRLADWMCRNDVIQSYLRWLKKTDYIFQICEVPVKIDQTFKLWKVTDLDGVVDSMIYGFTNAFFNLLPIQLSLALSLSANFSPPSFSWLQASHTLDLFCKSLLFSFKLAKACSVCLALLWALLPWTHTEYLYSESHSICLFGYHLISQLTAWPQLRHDKLRGYLRFELGTNTKINTICS